MSLPHDVAPKSSLRRRDRGPLQLPRSLLTAVGVGCAFGAGIVLGGGMKPAHGASQSTLAEQHPLAVARARTEALAEVREEVRLTFHEELAAPPPKAGAPAPAAKPVEQAPAKAPAPASKPVEAPPEKQAAAAKQEEGGELPPADPEVAAAARASEQPAAPPPAPKKVEEQRPQDDDEGSVVVARHDPARLAAAMAKVLGDDAPKAKSSRFGLQVASFPTEAAADEMAAKLRAKGHAASVAAGEVAGKGTVYRVRVGSYGERAEAESAKERLAGEGLQGFLISY